MENRNNSNSVEMAAQVLNKKKELSTVLRLQIANKLFLKNPL